MTSRTDHVPAPADYLPGYGAKELLDEIYAKGGRVFRMRERPMVFVLTTSRELAEWLQQLGGKLNRPVHMPSAVDGYERARGGVHEWDIWVHTIQTDGDERLWDLLVG